MKHTMSKRILSLFLALMMTLGILPMGVLATGEGGGVTVSVGLYDGRGDSPGFVAPRKQITLTPGLAISYGYNTPNLTKNADKVTIFDALVKLHEIAFGLSGPEDKNAATMKDALAIGEGGFITTVMGEKASVFSFMKNGRMPNDGVPAYGGDYTGFTADNAVLNEDDVVEFFFYADSYYGDYYTWFEQNGNQTTELSVPAGEHFSLDLKGYMAMYYGCSPEEKIKNFTLPMTGIQLVTVNDSGTMNELTGAVTDEKGVAPLSFSEEGSYTLSAKGNSTSAIIAPLCTVTVTPPLSDDAKRELIEADKATLDFASIKGKNTASDAVTEALVLPKIGQSGKAAITWHSSNPAVIREDGTVIRPLFETGNQNVKLTATLSYGTVTDTKEISVTVSALPSSAEVLEALCAALPAELTPKEWDGDTKKDSNVIEMVRTLVKAENPSADVANSCEPSMEQTQIAADGSITYGENQVSKKNVTFNLTLGTATLSYTPAVTVNKKAATKAEAFEAAWLTFDAIKGKNQNNTDVTADLSLPKEDPSDYYTELEWTSSNPEVIEIASYAINNKFPAKIRRPVVGQGAATVTLTAKIKPGSYWSYGMAPAGPMPSPAYGTKTFTLTVPAVTTEELGAAQTLVEEGIALFSLDHATIMGTSEKANLQALTYHIANIPYNWNYVDDLPGFQEAYRVADVKWSSTNPGIGDVTTGAVITRTDKEQTGDIVLTLSYNGAKAEKHFPVTVPAFTQADATAENEILQAVSDALTFDTIRNSNLLTGEVTNNLIQPQAAIKNGEKIAFQTKTAYHHVGANIAWTSSNPAVISNTLKVTRPTVDTQVTLTATMTSPRFANCTGVSERKKTFTLTVLAKESTHLLDNIAASYAAQPAQWWGSPNTGTWWNVVGMGAYKAYVGDSTTVISPEAKQAFVNKTLALVSQGDSKANNHANLLANAINALSAMGYNPTDLWTVNKTQLNAASRLKNINIQDAKMDWYSTIAPYVLVALNQGAFDSAAQEQAHVAYLLEELPKSQDWIDSYAMMLQGLSYYYDQPEVKTAVDAAITLLSQKQTATGSYGDANSDAMTILALSQLGIRADSDPRFIKNGNSLLDGLLRYQLSTHDGFGYSDATNRNELATQQGFLALIAAYQVISTGTAYDAFSCTALPKSPAYANGNGSSELPPPPSGTQDITVSFSVQIGNQMWIPKTSFTLKKGATVYHALTTVLNQNGFSCTGANAGYVRSITKPDGTTLSEFDQGPNSGWLYKVNGTLPDKSLTEYTLSSRDEIAWYFTPDWTKDEDASKIVSSGGTSGATVETPARDQIGTVAPSTTVSNGAATATVSESEANKALESLKKNNGTELVIAPVIKGNGTVQKLTVSMPKDTVSGLSKDSKAALTVKSDVANIRLSAAALSTIAVEAGTSVSIHAEKVDHAKMSEENKALVGDHPVYDFSVTVGSKAVTDFQGTVTVTLPYTLKPGENPQKLTIYYLDKAGKATEMTGVRYDASTKGIVFETTHFSTFAVVYDESKLIFTDVSKNDWFYGAVSFALANKLLNGTSDLTFSPQLNMNRAMLFTVLYRMNGKTTEQSGDTWYSVGMEWAKSEGISDGTAPTVSITREQLVTMLYRYAIFKGYDTSKAAELSSYIDGDAVSDWAQRAMQWAVGTGVISGRTSNTLVPQGTASRAEVAVMLQRFMASFSK